MGKARKQGRRHGAAAGLVPAGLALCGLFAGPVLAGEPSPTPPAQSKAYAPPKPALAAGQHHAPQAPEVGKTGGAPEELEVFQDWKKLCEPAPDKTGKVCFGFQKVNHNETRVQLLQAVVGYFRADISDPTLIVTVPLGAYLRPGLELRPADKTPIKSDFQYCFSNGCQAAIRLDPEKLILLNALPEADVVFLDAGHQRISVPLSLKGFGALVAALKPKGGKPPASSTPK